MSSQSGRNKMVEDYRRTASDLMDQFGDAAAMEAAMRSNAALEAGDMENYERWQRVMNSIQALTVTLIRPEVLH